MNLTLTLSKISFNKAMTQETPCFSATVLVDDKEIGTVTNRGTGGCNDYFWTNRAVGARLEKWAEEQQLTGPDGTAVEFEKLDHLIGKLLGQWEEDKQLRRWCKTKTVVKLKGSKPGEYAIWNVKFTPQVKAGIMAKQGDKVDHIVNERFV